VSACVRPCAGGAVTAAGVAGDGKGGLVTLHLPVKKPIFPFFSFRCWPHTTACIHPFAPPGVHHSCTRPQPMGRMRLNHPCSLRSTHTQLPPTISPLPLPQPTTNRARHLQLHQAPAEVRAFPALLWLSPPHGAGLGDALSNLFTACASVVCAWWGKRRGGCSVDGDSLVTMYPPSDMAACDPHPSHPSPPPNDTPVPFIPSHHTHTHPLPQPSPITHALPFITPRLVLSVRQSRQPRRPRPRPRP
jgi:hypothetical protein